MRSLAQRKGRFFSVAVASTEALSHKRPASTETFRKSYGAAENDKRKPMQLHDFRLHRSNNVFYTEWVGNAVSSFKLSWKLYVHSHDLAPNHHAIKTYVHTRTVVNLYAFLNLATDRCQRMASPSGHFTTEEPSRSPARRLRQPRSLAGRGEKFLCLWQEKVRFKVW